jgi:hypothetical protein
VGVGASDVPTANGVMAAELIVAATAPLQHWHPYGDPELWPLAQFSKHP